MDFFWVYDLPNWLFGVLMIGAWVTFAVVGTLVCRPIVRDWCAEVTAHNEFVSYFLSATGVFYGITLGLIAVGVWQEYSDVNSVVSREAAALGALHRDVIMLPAPAGEELGGLTKEYCRFVIDEAWPLQRKGEIPSGGTRRVSAINARLAAFEPRTMREQTVHAEAFDQLNRMTELRRMRVDSVGEGMPAALWAVVFIGGALSVAAGWFFYTPRLRLHLILMALMGALIGLLVFMTAAMDHPYRGEVSVGPESFELIYKDLMGG